MPASAPSEQHWMSSSSSNSSSTCTAEPSRQRSERCSKTMTMERRRHRPSFLILLAAFIACLAETCLAESQQCAVGLKTPGRTWPAGDIVLEHGNSLSIHCILNKTFIENSFPGKNSSDLVFFKGQRQIEPEFISVLNETTIRLDISEPPPENAMYYCKLRLDKKYVKDYEAVCLNKVVVGFKPQEPRNFNCISRNWENITCSWDPPHNYVDTLYSITFKLPGRAGGRKVYPCPSDTKPLESGAERPRNTCYWDTMTNPLYRQPYDYYTFFLVGENVLGNWSGSYKFHHFAHVIPARPANLTVVNKTLESALLHWTVSFPMQTFPPGLHHRVAYQSQWDDVETWKIINITDESHVIRRYYNLTNLQYANAIYDVRVFMKSAVATGEDKWSNFSDVTFRTPARVPGQSPRTDVGSFEVFENNINRDIYLYWQSIPEYLENGNNFHYQVAYVKENDRRVSLAPNETTRTYAKFRGLDHNSSYRFEIVASNEVGVLDKPAQIFVPSKDNLPKEPIAFTKIAFEDGLYELSWKPPINGDNEIMNYTIFWCENERDRPYQCQGYLEWEHVPKKSMVHNITVPDPRKVYQFAISANTKRASSGMVWASCTVIHNKVVGKMKTVWINRIGSTNIEVGWKLDCSDRIGIVEGFKIYYCPIVSPYNRNCKGPQLNTTIKADLNTIRGEVTGLKPYTTYMIAVSVLTKNGEGQHSDPLYNTTLESSPTDPPRKVVVRNVTNSSMFIEWKDPLAMNGVLRYYVIYYDNMEKKVEEVPLDELTGLYANHNYSIRVAACTVDCSPKSAPVYARTEIGVPGNLNAPTVRFVNSSQVLVIWMKPHLPAGPINYYQIKSNNGDIQNITSQDKLLGNTTLSIPDCQTVGTEKLHKFQVRAVNIAPNSEHLYGNWSEAGEGNCFSKGPSYEAMVIIWVIGSICGIAFVFCVAYSSKRIWIKCRQMQDVDVKLPAAMGMAPNMKLLQKSGDQHTRQSSADSSGCSSGQESVTSSLTSDSQVSSDSGADVDPVVSTKNLIIDATTASTTTSSLPAWEGGSLRQRNVSGASKPSLEPAAARWDPYVKVGKGSNELIVPSAPPADSLSLARSTPNLSDNIGYATSHQTWSSTGYISMPSSEDLSNNPSPVPKENPATGSYSVVGILPKTPIRCKSDEESLANIKAESETKPPNPYVSLVSLEQKSKDNRAMESLQAFDKLAFDKQPQHQSQQQHDKLSRPYVQTGFIDSSKKLPFDTRRKPTMTTITPSSNFLAQSTLAEELSNKLTPQQKSSSKPYVAVGSIPETMRKPTTTMLTDVPAKSSREAAYTTVGVIPSTVNTTEVKSTLAQPMSSMFQMLQQPKLQDFEASTSTGVSNQKVGLYPSLDLESQDSASLSNVSLPSSPGSTFTTLCWQPDEATILADSPECDFPRSTPTPQSATKTSSGYVSLTDQKQAAALAQRFTAKQPQSATVETQSSDEKQYSKVAVVPRTMH